MKKVLNEYPNETEINTLALWDTSMLFTKGFTTLEIGDGKYRIITSYKNRDDAWEDYMCLCSTVQSVPVEILKE